MSSFSKFISTEMSVSDVVAKYVRPTPEFRDVEALEGRIDPRDLREQIGRLLDQEMDSAIASSAWKQEQQLHGKLPFMKTSYRWSISINWKVTLTAPWTRSGMTFVRPCRIIYSSLQDLKLDLQHFLLHRRRYPAVSLQY